MRSRIAQIISFISLACCSCGEDTSENRSGVSVSTSSVVVDEDFRGQSKGREVGQSRFHLLRGAAAGGGNFTSRDFQLASLSRSTGVLGYLLFSMNILSRIAKVRMRLGEGRVGFRALAKEEGPIQTLG